MYKCQICNCIVPPGVRCCKYVEKTRRKDYPFRHKANPGYISKNGLSVKSHKSRDRANDNGGTGWEIARELNCCPKCLAKIQGKEEVEVSNRKPTPTKACQPSKTDRRAKNYNSRNT